MTHDLRFERVIDAAPEEVFDAFTRPDGQRAFYGQDDPGWIVQSECDLRVGGVWTVAFGPSPSELYRHEHVFRAIERPRRLLLATTEIRLDGSTFKTELELTFEDRDGRTLMTMVQRGFPTVELRDEHERGLPNAFARLQRVVNPRGGA
jgi:uncharacterized protein YndB with AHSA1/START domain